jgi:hypothetical protein
MRSLAANRNSPPLIKPEGSLPCSQEPAIGPGSELMNPAQTLQPYFPTINFNIILLSDLFALYFPTEFFM